jgi:hypothetical protein
LVTSTLNITHILLVLADAVEALGIVKQGVDVGEGNDAQFVEDRLH